MRQVNLKAEVHCLKPSWVNFENNRYRLYVNEDMLTERLWIWDIKTYIDENIWVELESNKEHLLRIVPVLDPINSWAKFALKNLRIDGNNYPYFNEDILELTFKI